MSQTVKGLSCCSNLELLIIFPKDNPRPFSSVVPSQPALGVSGLHQAHLHHYTHPSGASSMQSMLWKPLTTTCRWLLFLRRCVQNARVEFFSSSTVHICDPELPWLHSKPTSSSGTRLSNCLSLWKRVMRSSWLTICFAFGPWVVKLQPLYIWCQGAVVN